MIKTNWKARIIVWIADKINPKFDIIAVTWSPNIYIYPADKQTERLIKHESCHLKQQKDMGKYKFLAVYIYQFLKYGYWNMPLEVEARGAENV